MNKTIIITIMILLFLFSGCKSAGEAFTGTTVKVCCNIEGKIYTEYTLEKCVELGGKRVACPEGSMIPKS